MKNLLVKCFVIFGLIIISFACHFETKEQIEEQKKDDDWKQYATQTVNHWVGRKMIVPELPVVFQDTSSLDYKHIYTAPIKIVTYIDGSCEVCVSSLIHWQKFIISTPWIFDDKMKFIGDNNLGDTRFQTALLNPKDQVLMIGNIMLRPQLEQLYKEIIAEENKNGFK
jgi:hypothetical protein